MADAKIEGEELKKLVKMGKKRRLSFAFCPGPKNDHYMLIDRRKKPEVIGKVAKKEGSGSKVAFGTFVVNSKTMELTCERVVPAMAKVLKKYLKSQKVLVNVLIMDEQGNVLERDEEELPEDPSFADADDDVVADDDTGQNRDDQGQDDGAESSLNARELAQRLKTIQPALAAAQGAAAGKLKKVAAIVVSQIKSGDLEAADKTLTTLEGAVAKLGSPDSAAPQAEPQASAEPAGPDARALAARATALRDVIGGMAGPAGEKLTKALGSAAKQIKSGELAAADDLLMRIETAVNKAAGDSNDAAQSPEAAKWAKAEARLQPAVDILMQEKRGDLDAINRFFNYAKEQAAAGNYDKAMAAATRVAGLVKQAEGETTTAAARDAQEAAPDNVVAYTKTRLAWVNTRSGLRKELEGLKSAIDKVTAGIDGLEDVPANSGVLFDYLNGIDSNLEDTLEQLVETPDGDRRENLKLAARKIIDQYRGVLDTDFFQAVDNNGFVSTNIRANALNSLQEVSAALES